MKEKELNRKVEKWLMKNEPAEYCLRQVLKMCHYVAIVQKIEILSINADFYIDRNGIIWFFYAYNIVYRK